ncbi:cyclically-permuted mutarotase family protein [Fusobacterium sp.]|uniref:cyclically-permuted mutarotase family protein n=1 Tax=Fusobacterium sp. TaxID=68766 RepID=UPI00290008C8|nr:cyclically-permuted mutarotase family protein [Fusobacterium sp.]MDU1911833.1 cyclically-permuted mutarotase family protein [Fusobacterium sp.]
MKKFIFTVILSGLILGGCSSTEVKNQGIERKITWEHAGDLPAQKGFEKNIGTAGVLSGVLDEKYVVVGGGANFPYDTVLNGGAKKLYSDVYLLEEKDGKLEVAEHTNLDNEIGYGASVTVKDGVYYIGGGATAEADNDILFLNIKNGKLSAEKIGDLPFTLQNGTAVEKDGKLYIISGKQNGKATNKIYEYNIATGEIKELAPVPGGATRTQAVSQILDGKLYVFSGGDSTAYTDGYKYDFAADKWTSAASVELDGKGISLLGASSVKLNEKEMMVIGGFNKEVYDNAVANLGSLKGEELARFKAEYFGADPAEFNWNREILIYNSDSDSWKSIGQVPFDAPCGEGLVLIGNKIFSINGEIKPGVRTARMYTGTIIKK